MNLVDADERRRATLLQLNLGEGRHNLACEGFHGRRAQRFPRYREGQTDPPGLRAPAQPDGLPGFRHIPDS
nr:hypothetical protein [Paraburkholderia eburnea]